MLSQSSFFSSINYQHQLMEQAQEAGFGHKSAAEVSREDDVDDLDFWAKGHEQGNDVTQSESLQSDNNSELDESESELEPELEPESELESEFEMESLDDNLDSDVEEEEDFSIDGEKTETPNDDSKEAKSPIDTSTVALYEIDLLSLAVNKNETGFKEPSRNRNETEQMSEGDLKMASYFTNLTESAKQLKINFNQTPSANNTEQVVAHQATIRHFSQLLWQDLFEFVQYVTCSNHPVVNKLKWLNYADVALKQTYEPAKCPLSSSYHKLMTSLISMARTDPFCRPQSYIDFFGQGNYGLTLDGLVQLQQLGQETAIPHEQSALDETTTLIIAFIAGVVFAFGMVALSQIKKKRAVKKSAKIAAQFNYLDTQGISSVNKEESLV